MEHDDGSGSEGDQIQFGSAGASRWAVSRWASARYALSWWRRVDRHGGRWLTAAVAVVIVVAAAVAVGVTGVGRGTRPAPASPAASPGLVPGPVAGPVAGSVAVERLGYQFLPGEGPVPAGDSPAPGESANWELLGLGGGWEPGADGGVLVRVQFGEGVVTLTKIPALDSDGPVSVIGTGGETVIRPLDFVPGYLVPDGHAARALPAAVSDGGLIFPGPGSGELWVGGRRGVNLVLRLVTMTGTPACAACRAPTGSVIRLPANGDLAVPDGNGYVLVQDGESVDDVRPDGVHRVASGTLVATGSSGWLVSTCPGTPRCVNTVIDPATGIRRVLPGHINFFSGQEPYWPPGAVCADGEVAALLRNGRGQNGIVHLVNLRTGKQREIGVGRLSPNASFSLVWSPGSRWLFTLTAGGAIEAIDVRSGHARSLGVTLPPVSYLAAGTS